MSFEPIGTIAARLVDKAQKARENNNIPACTTGALCENESGRDGACNTSPALTANPVRRD